MPWDNLKIILASQSPRRRDLLNKHGFHFEVIPSMAEEEEAHHDTIVEVVAENARIKGREVLKRHKGKPEPQSLSPTPTATVLIAADTLVVMGEKVYPKPRDMVEARQFLRELGGQPHKVLSGVFLYWFEESREKTFVEHTHVTLQHFSEQEITALFEKVPPLDKAAAYGFQDAPEIVQEMDGSAENVMGLPMERLKRELKTWFGTI